jgi:hypothetical protein
MARGGSRAGAGRKPKTLEELRLTGMFRPARHSHLLTLPAVVPSGDPVPAVLDGLSGRGAAFVRAVWAEYGGWTSVTEMLLHEAGRLVDQLETLRGTKGERAAQRMLLSTLAALNLKEG